jgi:Lipopolysaccharide kinase (Kdo/WaaP) family
LGAWCQRRGSLAVADCYLREDLAAEIGGAADAAANLNWALAVADAAAPDDIYRSREGRRTLRFSLGEHSYFLKLHSGIGWGEVLKNLLQARLPVLGAGNEYRAVQALQHIGVDTMSVAEQGANLGAAEFNDRHRRPGGYHQPGGLLRELGDPAADLRHTVAHSAETLPTAPGACTPPA